MSKRQQRLTSWFKAGQKTARQFRKCKFTQKEISLYLNPYRCGNIAHARWNAGYRSVTGINSPTRNRLKNFFKAMRLGR